MDPLFPFAEPEPLKPWQGGKAVARRTDPKTSHDAAASLSVDSLSRSRRAVLDVLREHGPLTDPGIYSYLAFNGGRVMSSSGARTRRAELVEDGWVRDTGKRQRLPSGRYSIVWCAV